ncbi:D,D-heptose 1,7-bisphosphate phosphatase [Candidatus Marinamargulisbacteria bacterium SCGC AG-439-L15]|nr:D,D-heptose 1,7-bisphosphate phosphatase [Candidatus Marinamargulisbacteria bacterium SCGC AG-439-L15]
MNKAVFFDRDGTLIKDVPYLGDPSLVQLEDRVVPALRLLQKESFGLIIVTNQSGIGRGLITEDDYHQVHHRLISLLKDNDIEIDETFYCPYHETEGQGEYKKASDDRKPGPGMLLKALKKYDLSPENCYMIGDKRSDIQAGQSADIKSVLVRTGDGESSISVLEETVPDYVAEDTYDAVVNYVLGE